MPCPNSSSVEIVEVIRRSQHGMTKPFLCRGSDSQFYFVKGKGAGRESQIKEWIAGNLALKFEIPVAPFKIVNVPEELLEALSEDDSTDLGVGPAFGSLEQRITELSYSNVSEVPLELRKSVLCFDWWIANGDRNLTDQGGNPNLFWEPDSRKLVVIDHNQSFDPYFHPENFFKYHAFKSCSSGIADDFLERENYTSRMRHALNSWRAIVDDLPEEWFYIDQEMTIPVKLSLESLLRHLQRFDSDDFWKWK